MFLIISLLIAFFSGCAGTPLPLKEKPALGSSAKFSFSENVTTTDSSAKDNKGIFTNFHDLQSLTSTNSLQECIEYACCVHNAFGKGISQGDFPVVARSEVKEFIQYFQRNKDFMRKSLEQSGVYFPLMKSVLRENELPEDLVFLALIESGFNPYAYSRAGACGPWQFMKATGRMYGLKVDLWVDERRDPEKSTRAAVHYLKDLYARFGDWYLAITAYNAGERKVANAMKRYKTDKFWVLQKKRYLKLESRNYVPKLLAAILIGKHPEEYGFADISTKQPAEFTSFTIPYPTELKFIAQMAGISLKTLKQCNPELRKWCTPPTKKGYSIKIPLSNKQIFARNFALNKAKFLTGRTFHEHRIKPGETLYNIARHYNTKVAHIQKMNKIRNPRLIRPGKVLIIPIPAIISSS